MFCTYLYKTQMHNLIPFYIAQQITHRSGSVCACPYVNWSEVCLADALTRPYVAYPGCERYMKFGVINNLYCIKFFA